MGNSRIPAHSESPSLCSRLWRSICRRASTFHIFLYRVNPFLIQLFYFVFTSLIGFWFLEALKPRASMPHSLDMFFMSVSATTVSSMSTVEMEVFSNAQLVIMTVLMFVGGEVFVSLVGLHLSASFSRNSLTNNKGGLPSLARVTPDDFSHVELGTLGKVADLEQPELQQSEEHPLDIKYSSLHVLVLILLAYLLIIQFFGIASVLGYMWVVPTAREALENKGLKIMTYAVFTIVSSFTSCGFTPNNENMVLFSKNSGLLLIILPQLLLGNTVFPSCLRFLIRMSGRFWRKRECEYLLNSDVHEIGYHHLLPRMHSRLLPLTVFGFIALQMILFCAMEWNSGLMSGMTAYQKFVGSLFQCVNSRHTGEGIVNLAAVAPAVLVLFIVMMYLPPYTSFLPQKYDEDKATQVQDSKHMSMGRRLVENVLLSQLSCLVIFTIAICIIERKNMAEDPLNFNVLNIALEVVSAFGNVGFSAGYSCELRLNTQATCTDKYYGFAGKWSNLGKIILIIVMLYGRLKKFSLHGGKAWKLE